MANTHGQNSKLRHVFIWSGSLANILSEQTTLFVTCPLKLTPFLEQEISSLGFVTESVSDVGVSIKGSIREAMALCLHSRIASRVLLLLKEFYVRTPMDMYKSVYSLPWEDIIPDDGYFTVITSIDTKTITNTHFAGQKCKDGIVDRIRKHRQRRPDSGAEKDKTVIFLYWHHTKCSVYVDMSGNPLHRRGYRLNPWKAPMRENLAAAVISATVWAPYSMPFVNPMCGSGTLAIEAAMMASDTAPGSLRKNYGFMHVFGYDKELWRHLLLDAMQAKRECEAPRIFASDIHPGAIRIARENAKVAGVEEWIDWSVCDVRDLSLPDPKGIIIMNPEYGQRLGSEKSLEEEYKEIGDLFKQRCSDWTGYVFTGNLQAAKSIGLRTSKRIPFFNADIECRLLEFPLYKGKKE
ncbi:MAG: class I SAM-dependent RNA methyltransferase [Bacteroidota bacterium]